MPRMAESTVVPNVESVHSTHTSRSLNTVRRDFTPCPNSSPRGGGQSRGAIQLGVYLWRALRIGYADGCPPTYEPGVHRNSWRREGSWVPPCGGCTMNTPPTIEVICPCCQARLSIDLGLKAVIHHEAAAKATPTMDLKEALGALEIPGQSARGAISTGACRRARKRQGVGAQV